MISFFIDLKKSPTRLPALSFEWSFFSSADALRGRGRHFCTADAFGWRQAGSPVILKNASQHSLAHRAERVASMKRLHLGGVMIYYAIKILISASLIVLISEIAKRSTGFAALVASLPLTSLLAFVWLGVEGAEPEKIAELSSQIFWLIVPSLVLFPLLAVLLRAGTNLWVSLAVASAATALAYLALLPVLKKFGLIE
jgi:hypothetical protein